MCEKENLAEKVEVLICPKCTVDYGESHVVVRCSECEQEFEEGEKVFCSSDYLDDVGKHWCEECWKEKKQRERVDK